MSAFRQLRLSEYQVEALLTDTNREESLAVLATRLDDFRSLRDLAPSTPQATLVAQAATLARNARAERPSRPPPAPHRPRPVLVPHGPRRSWRLAPAIVAGALALTTFMPIAAIANSAVPGDALYGLDIFLERIGIGAGGLTERLDEVEVLHHRGKTDDAVLHLAESVRTSSEHEFGTHRQWIVSLAEDLIAADPELPGTLHDIIDTEADQVAPSSVEQPTVTDPVSGNDGQGNEGHDNPNKGPGNNSGNGNQGEDNPNKGPDNNSGNGNQGEDNPNKGPDNNSGNGNGNGNGNQGEDNPNKGPGNNSGNGNGPGNP